MRAVRGKDTLPELLARKMLHAAGYRYRVQLRLARKRPDIIFAKRRCVILVHGCFWHGHNCRRGRLPQANTDFWYGKITRNKERDEETIAALDAEGWRSLVIWECDLKDRSAVFERLSDFLGPPSASYAASRP